MSAVVYHFREVMRCKILRLASMPSSTNGGNFIHIEWKSWGIFYVTEKNDAVNPRRWTNGIYRALRNIPYFHVQYPFTTFLILPSLSG